MPTADDLAVATALVRQHDPDLYHAALLAPADKRPALLGLYAFATEIARVRQAVSNPMPGEIRLQWWRDAIAAKGGGGARGDAAGHPIFALLDDAITRFRLPRSALVDMIDARVFDLYDDPMPSLADLQGYLGETTSALVRLAAIVLADGHDPGAADAAGHAGLAIGLTNVLRTLPAQARAGQLFLPADLLGRYGVTRDDVVLGRGGPGLVSSLEELRTLAREHLNQARRFSGAITPRLRPAFAPLALVPRYLAAMERPGYDPFGSSILLPAWRTIPAQWWFVRRGWEGPVIPGPRSGARNP